jgi:hypothetical protein
MGVGVSLLGKLTVSGTISILAVVGIAGCRSPKTNHASSLAPRRIATYGACNAFGETASYYLPSKPSKLVPPTSDFFPFDREQQGFRSALDVPADAIITRKTIGGFCYTTPETIDADERARDSTR